MALFALVTGLRGKLYGQRRSKLELTTPFLRAKHLPASSLTHLYINEMRIAFQEAREEGQMSMDKVESDRSSGSFRHEDIFSGLASLTPAPRSLEDLIKIKDADYRYSKYMNDSRDSLPLGFFPELPKVPSAIESYKSWESFEGFTNTTIASDASISGPAEALPQSVSWVSFKFTDSRDVSLVLGNAESTDSISENAVVVDKTEVSGALADIPKDSASVVRPLCIVEKKAVEGLGVPTKLSSMTPTDATRVASASLTYKDWMLEQNKKMAAAILSDHPFCMPDTPPRFKVKKSPVPIIEAPVPFIPLSTSTSFRKWRRAEGARIAQYALTDEPYPEMEDIPLRFKQAHPVLVACRERVKDFTSLLEKNARLPNEECAKDIFGPVAPPAAPIANGADGMIHRNNSLKRFVKKATPFSRRGRTKDKENAPPSPFSSKGHRRSLSISSLIPKKLFATKSGSHF